jgi:hypothetical protein
MHLASTTGILEIKVSKMFQKQNHSEYSIKKPVEQNTTATKTANTYWATFRSRKTLRTLLARVF